MGIASERDCRDERIRTAPDRAVYARALPVPVQSLARQCRARASISGPTAAARQAAALDQVLAGHLLLNVVPAGGPHELAAAGLVRGGADTALVGDPGTVVARMREYPDLGIEGARAAS